MRCAARVLIGGLFVLTPLSIAAQDAGPTTTIWQTSEGEMALPANPATGQRIKIPYTQDGGRILGAFTLEPNGDRILDGHWVEESSAEACETSVDGSYYWGRITFVFDPQFASFDGLWAYCNAGLDRGWSGQNTDVATASTNLAPGPGDARIDQLVERLKLERQRSGPRPVGSAPINYTDADLSLLAEKLSGLDIAEGDMDLLVNDYFGADGAFDAGKWDGFPEYVNRRRVTSMEQSASRSFENALREWLGLPEQATEYLRDRFYQSDTLIDEDLSRTYGHGYDAFVLASLETDPKLTAMLSEESRAHLANLTAPEPIEGPFVRPREEGDADYYSSDCRYSAVLQRMRQADPTFAIKYDIYVIWASNLSLVGPGSDTGISGGGSAVRRDLLVAGVREAIRQCERNR